MNRVRKVFALILLITPLTYFTGCAATPSQPYSRMGVGGSFVNGELNSFYFALSEYYRVPERDVIFIHERHIPDYDIPVVLFISQRARVTPLVIIDLRLAGSSWMDISLRFGLGPDIYYVPVQKVYGPPYGHAYGYYQNRNRNEWHNIRLEDDDVVNLVNLRFISERYGHPPEEVIRMRSSGRNFVTINDEVRSSKKGSEYRQPERRDVREPVMQQERQEKEIRQQERREIREPVQQQGVQQRVIPQPDRKVVREPAKQQAGPGKASRQQGLKETRSTVKKQERQKKESRQKKRSDVQKTTGQQDKKGSGRSMDDGKTR